MKKSTTLTGIALATAIAASAQNDTTTYILSNAIQANSDTTIIKPYFIIHPDVKKGQFYQVDLVKSQIYPDDGNTFIIGHNYDVFSRQVKAGLINPSQVPGQLLLGPALDNISDNPRIYKTGSNDKIRGGRCLKDCDKPKYEKQLLDFLNNTLSRKRQVCTYKNTVKGIAGIMSASEAAYANKIADKIIAADSNLDGVVVTVMQSNNPEIYSVNGQVVIDRNISNRGVVLYFPGTKASKGKVEIFEEQLNTLDQLGMPKEVPCDGCGDGSGKLKAYIGPTLGYNTSLEALTIGAAAGLNFNNKFTVGLTYDAGKGKTSDLERFDGPAGFTEVDTVTDNKIKSFGAEISGKINNSLILYLGLQKHNVTANSDVNVTEYVRDLAGTQKVDFDKYPGISQKYSYNSINPGIGLQISPTFDVLLNGQYNLKDKKFDAAQVRLRANIGGRNSKYRSR